MDDYRDKVLVQLSYQPTGDNEDPNPVFIKMITWMSIEALAEIISAYEWKDV